MKSNIRFMRSYFIAVTLIIINSVKSVECFAFRFLVIVIRLINKLIMLVLI